MRKISIYKFIILNKIVKRSTKEMLVSVFAEASVSLVKISYNPFYIIRFFIILLLENSVLVEWMGEKRNFPV